MLNHKNIFHSNKGILRQSNTNSDLNNLKNISNGKINIRKKSIITQGQLRSANKQKWNSPSENYQDTTNPDATLGQLIFEIAKKLKDEFFEIDMLIHSNIIAVQKAFYKYKIGPHHFSGSTGYGHGDIGRMALDKVFSEIFKCEAALVRPHFVSGTHAISSALFGVLRPGDELLCVTGHPYDTLEEVIGLRQNKISDIGSLKDWKITYKEIDINDNYDKLKEAIKSNTKVAYIQRSCGYTMKATLTITEISNYIKSIKKIKSDIIILVDNCYGEFTEKQEPTSVGADLVMGSLIKSIGGTIAPTGGYVAGKQEYIERVSARLNAPGIGYDAGSISSNDLRLLYQGLFLAPQIVGESLKSGILISSVMENFGYKINKKNSRSIITAIELGTKEKMIKFCEGIQKCSPVASYVKPVPGVVSGYENDVIFADGTFIDGSTSELSADGPLRPPFVVYCQGGTHWTHWLYALEFALLNIL